ncbi:Uncharacterised protein [Mycobacteroides abscessus subsp. massiliense]|nr:Uncharacterised protein [Mycobacteroides abscessus subsp. massiliense]
MLLVLVDPAQDRRIVLVRFGAERRLTFEQQIDEVVGPGATEVVAHLRDGLYGRGVIGQE